MKQILLMIAVVMGQSVLAADVVITDPFVWDLLAKMFKKPSGKYAPPLKFTDWELAKVTSLDLNDTKITDAGLKEIAKLQQLTSLHLNHTQITDAGIKDIAKLQQLTHLYLHETKITDACLGDIAKWQQLLVLSLRNTKITKAGAAELRKALPKCRITHSYQPD
jgi:hypothetical protein